MAKKASPRAQRVHKAKKTIAKLVGGGVRINLKKATTSTVTQIARTKGHTQQMAARKEAQGRSTRAAKKTNVSRKKK